MNPNSPQTLQQNAPQVIDPHYGNEGGGGMLKKLIIGAIILFVFIFIIVIAVIGSSILSANKKPKNVTLTYWGVWEDVSVMQPIIDDFERTNPTIKVSYEKQDIKGLGAYIDRLTQRIDNGKGPDIIRFHSSWVPQLQNYLLPFPKDVVDNTQLESDYYKTVQKDMKLNGVYYGIPLGIDTLAMFVNTDMLNNIGETPPTTWEQVSGITGKLRELQVVENDKILKAEVALGTYNNIEHAPDIISMLFLQDGADLRKLNGPTRVNAEKTLTFYTLFSKGDTKVWDDTLDNSKLAFIKGNLGIYFGYSWDIFDIKAKNSSLQFIVTKVPNLSGRKNTVASYWAEGVSRRSKSSKEAFKFLEYMSQPATLQKMYELQAKTRLFGALYPRRSMQSSLSSNVLIFPFVAQADDAQSSYFAADTYDGNTGMNTMLNNYLNKAIGKINDNYSVGTALDELSQGEDQVLSRYGL